MSLSKINDVLGLAVARLAEETLYTVNGKKGVWRTVRGHKVFFPSDGSDPVGMPKAMRTATGKKIAKAAKGRKGPKAKVTGGGAGGAGGGSSKKKKVPKKKTSSPKEIEAGKKKLNSKSDRKKEFGSKKEEMDGAASGSGGAAVDDMENSGTEEEKEALGKFDDGESMSKEEGRTLLSGGVKAAMAFGLGAMLLGAFPAILGYAAAALIMRHAIGSAGRRMSSVFEDKTSRRKQLAQAIEGGIKDAISRLAKGEADPGELQKAIGYAEKKSRGSE